MRSSSSFAKTTSGASARTASRKSSAPASRIALQVERSTLTAAPPSRASSAARSAALREGSQGARSRRRRGGRSPRATPPRDRRREGSPRLPRSAAIERPPSGETIEQMIALRSATGPAHLDAGRLQSREARAGPASSPPCLPTKRASRAELGGPRRDVRRLAAGREADLRVGVAARSDRPREPDEDVEREIAEGADKHAANRRSEDGRGAARGCAPHVFHRRRHRRVCRTRGHVRRRRIQRRRGRPRGLAAFESAPLLPRALEQEREAADLRDGRLTFSGKCPSTNTVAPTGTRSSSSRR